MRRRIVNAPSAPQPMGGYSQAIETSDSARTLFISGQIPMGADGRVPTTFGEQCRLVWENVGAQLRAADMSLDNLVKVTTFLSDRRYADENAEVRRRVLGDRTPALTVVIVEIFDPAWLLEIEAVAVA